VTAKDLARIGLALLFGAAVALPAGFFLGRLGGGGEQERPMRQGDSSVRDVFSPAIRSDPYFLARQREGIEALERHCARTGESCVEAHAARSRLTELERAD